MKIKILSFLYKEALRPVLFLFSSDFIHQVFLQVGNLLGRFWLTRALTKGAFYYESTVLEQEVSGIKYKNPVGLAAGFDKDADLIQILSKVGFGAMQIGTVTYNSYKGNPQPWTTRLKKSKALTVYFGLKNKGIKTVSNKISGCKIPNDFPIGISVGKTNATYTANETAGIEDYYKCLAYLEKQNLGDTYEINISCPNTFGGEPFTTKETLDRLLDKISTLGITKPVYLKMPINIPWEEFEQLCDVAVKHAVTGLVIGNLNKNRDDPAIIDPLSDSLKGNISGKPTKTLSNELISKTYSTYGDTLVIIGVGGIFSAADAYEKIKRGASMVQLITGMIYEGPQLIGEINRGLVKLVKNDGFTSIKQAIGTQTK